MRKVIFCPADDNHLEEFKRFEISLRKFHSKEELPLLRFENFTGDPHFFYRATPIIAQKLINEYDLLIKADSDQIVCGDLSYLWSDEDFDVGVVMNDPSYSIPLWDIAPPDRYYNMGLVVLKSKEFIEHWYHLCMSRHFQNYQFREQDILNLLCSDYFNYKVKWLEEKDFYGEQAKPYWARAKLEGNKIMIGPAELKIIHFGGGNNPNKGNYRILFQPDVIRRIEELIK
ncbi:MAG: hypothetical protein ACOY0S_04755 [Patescibacteria group bacterium]